MVNEKKLRIFVKYGQGEHFFEVVTKKSEVSIYKWISLKLYDSQITKTFQSKSKDVKKFSTLPKSKYTLTVFSFQI